MSTPAVVMILALLLERYERRCRLGAPAHRERAELTHPAGGSTAVS
ncbi:hypothetical protein [Amycolatopsis albispora]|nr:hypothetical protein [Amycolatopsis albispora]